MFYTFKYIKYIIIIKRQKDLIYIFHSQFLKSDKSISFRNFYKNSEPMKIYKFMNFNKYNYPQNQHIRKNYNINL